MNLFHTTLTRFGDEFLACTKQTISTLDGGVDSIQREVRDDGVIRLGFLRALGTQFVPQLASQFLKENKDNDIDVIADLKCDDLCRHRRSDVGSEDDGDCLRQIHQSCTYKTDRHNGCRTTAL